MLMRDTNNGAFEYYDISHNTITAAGSMGQVGMEWSVAGIAADPPPESANAQLPQAMSSFAPGGGTPPIGSQMAQPGQPPSASSLFVAPSNQNPSA
jgi:hypothetical protein